jgi:hypothetical protein
MADKGAWLPTLLGARTIQDDGEDLPARSAINFIGADIVDDPANDRTDITITGGGGGGSVTDETVTWAPAPSPHISSKAILKEFDTADAVQQTALTVSLATEALTDLKATVLGRSENDQHFRADLRGAWSETDGVWTEQANAAAANTFTNNPAGWGAVLSRSGASALVKVTGEAATDVRWSIFAETQVVSLDAAPVAAFDPATLSLTGWWRGNYTASPWVGTASAGSSGTRNVTEATNPPSTGAAQNLLVPALFDGTNDKLTSAINFDQFCSQGASSIWVLFYAVAAGADAGAGSKHTNKGILCCDTGLTTFNLTYSTSGVAVSLFGSGATWIEREAAAATGQYHLAQVRWDGVNLGLRLNSGAWSNVAAVAAALGAAPLVMGKNWNAAFANVRILDVGTAQTAFPDATFNNIKSYINTRYALAL